MYSPGLKGTVSRQHWGPHVRKSAPVLTGPRWCASYIDLEFCLSHALDCQELDQLYSDYSSGELRVHCARNLPAYSVETLQTSEAMRILSVLALLTALASSSTFNPSEGYSDLPALLSSRELKSHDGPSPLTARALHDRGIEEEAIARTLLRLAKRGKGGPKPGSGAKGGSESKGDKCRQCLRNRPMFVPPYPGAWTIGLG